MEDKSIVKSMLLYLLITIMTVESIPPLTRQDLNRFYNRDHVCSNLIKFTSSYYHLEERINITGMPADISVHWKTGNVYFTLISDDMKMSLRVLTPSGEIEPIRVSGLGQSTCIDNLNDIVYLATDNGVYKYKDGTLELFSALGEDVMYVATTMDGATMFIATWPQNRVQKITNDGLKQETFPAIPNGHGLTVDTRNNIYFVAVKTPYILKQGFAVPIKIKGLPSDRTTSIFLSRSDNVYAMDENSCFYRIDYEIEAAKKIGCFNVDGVNSFAMDSADNVLIGVKNAILKFSLHETNPCLQDKEIRKTGRQARKRKSKKYTTTTEGAYESEDFVRMVNSAEVEKNLFF